MRISLGLISTDTKLRELAVSFGNNVFVPFAEQCSSYLYKCSDKQCNVIMTDDVSSAFWRMPITTPVVWVCPLVSDRRMALEFRSGLSGIVRPTHSSEVILKTLTIAGVGGGKFIPYDLLHGVQAALNRDNIYALNPKQIQILRCLSEGMTPKETAEWMSVKPLSTRTVNRWCRRVKKILGVPGIGYEALSLKAKEMFEKTDEPNH